MKSNSEKQDFDSYLKEARSWEIDKEQELKSSRKMAWRVAGGASIIAFTAVFAVAAMMPLKTVETRVIRVNDNTGAVDVLQTLTSGKTNYDEAINKYFVQWYVRYREGYSKEIAEDYYSNVGILSNSIEQQKYYAAFNPKNPQSPLNVYGDYAKVKIDIQSTSFINPNVALVRYIKKVERGLDQPQVTHWAATIAFKYLNAPMKEKDRGINPLGFQVTEYRNDPDAAINNPMPNTTGQNQSSQQTSMSSLGTSNVVAFPTIRETPAPIALTSAVPAIQ